MQNTTVPALLPTYPPYPFPLVKGVKDKVFDDKGQAYWDFYGGHCVCSTGHAHPHVVKAIARQAEQFMFYSTAARIPVRDDAAVALIEFAKCGGKIPMASVFFCNSGTEANENALKVSSILTGRTKFASFVGGWHGRTTLSLSVTDDVKLRPCMESFLAPTTFLPLNDESALDAADLSECAAIILEPIQSMSGIRMASPSFFKKLREKCTASGTMLIFDEVQTGIGRLGTPFAAGFYGVAPDMITSAKGIASGMPMGALIMSEAVASRLKSGDLGSTFGGGPVVCAALLATLEVIQSEGLMERAAKVSAYLKAEVPGKIVSEVKGEGLLLGLKVPGGGAALKQHLLSRHILVGGSSDPEVLRLMSPLNISDEAIEALLAAIREL